jgi:hypothetical protein
MAKKKDRTFFICPRWNESGRRSDRIVGHADADPRPRENRD